MEFALYATQGVKGADKEIAGVVYKGNARESLPWPVPAPANMNIILF
jgi:hypothetical protein